MSQTVRINPPTLPDFRQHGFSQISITGLGRTAYISGQVAWTPDGGSVPDDLVEQMALVGDNARQARERRHKWCGMSASLLLLLTACDNGSSGQPTAPPTPMPTPSATPSTTPTSTPTPMPSPTPTTATVTFRFQQNATPWTPIFADYPAEQAANFELQAGLAPVAANLPGVNGFRLSGSNRSDLFMGIFREVDGLQPNAIYRVEVAAVFAHNFGPNCVGAGGDPGGAQFVKVGASSVIPTPVQNGFVQLPLDKGNQGTSGRDMVVIGDLSVAEAGCGGPNYFRKSVATDRQSAARVRADTSGRLWLVLGTDSGFEGVNTYYIIEGIFSLTRE